MNWENLRLFPHAGENPSDLSGYVVRCGDFLAPHPRFEFFFPAVMSAIEAVCIGAVFDSAHG